MSNPSSPESEARVASLLAQLTLEEKTSLTGGRDVWHLPPLERFGVGALKMSDGPSGVRGERWSTRRSLSFPCGLAVGATWDADLVGRYGAALAEEAKSKGVHLLLGPTVCIIRTPLAGRTFESFSEDPYLTSRLTVAYILGVQGRGVGCCVKHFACNDQEHERMTISAEVDPGTLREVHLRPFEAAVSEAGVWAVMSAYNRVNGTYCGEHPELLGGVLKGEWGFDGVVVSDWLGTHSTIDAATAGLDIEMPGPPSHLGEKLALAVESGEIDDSVVDEQARRILRLMHRIGLLDGPVRPDEAEDDDPGRRAVARSLAVGSTVLLRNEGGLPLDRDTVRSVAIIGPNARHLEPGGGGSSAVTPLRITSLVDEIRHRIPGVNIVYEEGCRLAFGLSRLDPTLLPGGTDLEYFAGQDLEGPPAGTDALHSSHYAAIGDPAPGVSTVDFSLRGTASFVPDQTGTWQIGIASAGAARIHLDGTLVAEDTDAPIGSTFFGLGSDPVATEIDLVAGEEHSLVVELRARDMPIAGFELYAARPARTDLLEGAVEAAARSDAAIVVVGADSRLETEGADRPDLRLAGHQDELVRRVAGANSRTIVVLNAGGPVELPWINDVAAALTVWYPGEEGPSALADVLVGDADPGGRLPVAFPRRVEDTAAHGWYPGSDGQVFYGEGLLIGQRHLDAHDIEPAFPLGHGLSYTTFRYGTPLLGGSLERPRVTLSVTNTGDRAGSDVVQAYAEPRRPESGRPTRQLAGFAKVTLDPGATTHVTIDIDHRAFTAWNDARHTWTTLAGVYDLAIGPSSADIRARLPITVPVEP